MLSITANKSHAQTSFNSDSSVTSDSLSHLRLLNYLIFLCYLKFLNHLSCHVQTVHPKLLCSYDHFISCHNHFESFSICMVENVTCFQP